MTSASPHDFVRIDTPQAYVPGPKHDNQLRLLSFNIQAGVEVQRFSHYVTRSWQHILPTKDKIKNLNRISDLLEDFDLVALQEADGGSLRSGFVNQVEYLAKVGKFPYWYQQCTRDFGHFGRYGNGLLSRIEPVDVEEHKLPGTMPGRGAIFLRYGNDETQLIVLNIHLALGRRSQERQLSYTRDLINEYEHVVIMGDMNTHAEHLLSESALRDCGLHSPAHSGSKTYPSWAPRRTLDHILVSDSIRVTNTWTPELTLSDHLPVAIELEMPVDFSIQRRAS
jgi:endonuclease/exonuclease/phosphatase family metal-dependent hydrolase